MAAASQPDAGVAGCRLDDGAPGRSGPLARRLR